MIRWALAHKRFFFFGMFMLATAGMLSYVRFPKEAFPDIQIPYIITTVTQVGISPEDGERLIAKPLEKEFKVIEGVKSINAKCYENYCFVI
jgi:multidrug efflux pump